MSNTRELEKNHPSRLDFDENKILITAHWWYNYSCDGVNDYPASIHYYKNGAIYYKSWLSQAGHYHRVTGPAYICYNRDGSIAKEKYYLLGIVMSKKDWLKNPSVIKHFRELKNSTKGNLINGVSL